MASPPSNCITINYKEQPMHVKKASPSHLLSSLLVLLSTLLAMSAFGSGPDDAPTIISLESVGKLAAKGATSDAMLNQAMQNDSNFAANANIAIQQTVPITTARTTETVTVSK